VVSDAVSPKFENSSALESVYLLLVIGFDAASNKKR
jgi:hypothetical protein